MSKGIFVTHSCPATDKMKEGFRFHLDLLDRVEEGGKDMDPWHREVMLDYAKRIMDLELSRFAFESIGQTHESMVRYSHQIQSDGENVRTIRLGKKEPSVLEKMALHHNVDI
jgi:hypothetical protein